MLYVRIYLSTSYHRLTRANTPDSVSFRRFLPFSPWWAPARLRLKNQKSLENTSLAGASSFVGAEMCPDKKRPAENTCRIFKGLDAGWAHFCPSKPCLPLSIDGNVMAAVYHSPSDLSPVNGRVKFSLLHRRCFCTKLCSCCILPMASMDRFCYNTDRCRVLTMVSVGGIC